MYKVVAAALFAAALILPGCASSESEIVRSSETRVASEPGEVLRHAVFFKFKDEASAQQIQAVVDAFRALPDRIPQIKDFEWGTNVSPEHHDQGFTHAFLLTFHSEADRDAYLPHPAHREFGQVLGPVLDKVFVIDYWARK